MIKELRLQGQIVSFPKAHDHTAGNVDFVIHKAYHVALKGICGHYRNTLDGKSGFLRQIVLWVVQFTGVDFCARENNGRGLGSDVRCHVLLGIVKAQVVSLNEGLPLGRIRHLPWRILGGVSGGIRVWTTIRRTRARAGHLSIEVPSVHLHVLEDLGSDVRSDDARRRVSHRDLGDGIFVTHDASIQTQVHKPSRNVHGGNRNEIGDDLVDTINHAERPCLGVKVLFRDLYLRAFVGQSVQKVVTVCRDAVPHELVETPRLVDLNRSLVLLNRPRMQARRKAFNPHEGRSWHHFWVLKVRLIGILASFPRLTFLRIGIASFPMHTFLRIGIADKTQDEKSGEDHHLGLLHSVLLCARATKCDNPAAGVFTVMFSYLSDERRIVPYPAACHTTGGDHTVKTDNPTYIHTYRGTVHTYAPHLTVSSRKGSFPRTSAYV